MKLRIIIAYYRVTIFFYFYYYNYNNFNINKILSRFKLTIVLFTQVHYKDHVLTIYE